MVTGSLFAIVIKDAEGPRLVARVARRALGVYYLIPRNAEDFAIEADENWDPHASYHADGTLHVKSFNALVLTPVKKQPLDRSFSGGEPLFAQSFQPGELVALPSLTDVSRYLNIFEIPRDLVDATEHHTLAVDLLSPGTDRLPGPWQQVVTEHSFTDDVPWIHVTLWRGLIDFAAT
jgi:hypothetical protein